LQPSSTLFPYTTLFRSNDNTVIILIDHTGTVPDTKSCYFGFDFLNYYAICLEYISIIHTVYYWRTSRKLEILRNSGSWLYCCIRSEEHTSELQSRENLV